MPKRTFPKLLALLAALCLLCAGTAGCSDLTPAEISAAIAAVSFAPLPSEAFSSETPAPDSPAPLPGPSELPDPGPAEPEAPAEIPPQTPPDDFVPGSSVQTIDFAEVPPYAGSPYVAIHGNVPYFDSREVTAVAFESYSPRDSLGRCGSAWASVGLELMPAEDRTDISEITPSGWNQAQTEDGSWLYNRCHLIGFQLTGENAAAENLITGTQYLNLRGMLPFENQTADYIRETGCHVMCRATPYFLGDELVCRGVVLEGLSVEDGGEGICFCVFAYNVQPGVEINYADGSSSAQQPPAPADVPATAEPSLAPTPAPTPEPPAIPVSANYIGNKNTGKFHVSSCPEIKKMKESNKVPLSSREEAIAGGYVGCKKCSP